MLTVLSVPSGGNSKLKQSAILYATDRVPMETATRGERTPQKGSTRQKGNAKVQEHWHKKLMTRNKDMKKDKVPTIIITIAIPNNKIAIVMFNELVLKK
eukprot:6134490-Amphidinium_carterae.1